MIWESKGWKDELLANARSIETLRFKRRSERRSFLLERAVFISVYVMRKLWEARKLSTSWEGRQIPCIFHPLKRREPDRLNWHRIDEHFNLNISKPNALTAIEFCHRLIHSYVFVEVEGAKQSIIGFYFASDQTKRRGLWFVDIRDLLDLLRETGRDYPSSAHMVRHPKTGEWIVWTGHGDPPANWANAVVATMPKNSVAR
jgi:hypothetical protein